MHRHRYNGSSLGGDETMGKSDLIEDETSLAYRLSNLRKDHDLSQKQLADQLHVTHSQISRIESGETKNPMPPGFFMFLLIICLESLRLLHPKVMIYRNLDCRKKR